MTLRSQSYVQSVQSALVDFAVAFALSGDTNNVFGDQVNPVRTNALLLYKRHVVWPTQFLGADVHEFSAAPLQPCICRSPTLSWITKLSGFGLQLLQNLVSPKYLARLLWAYRLKDRTTATVNEALTKFLTTFNESVKYHHNSMSSSKFIIRNLFGANYMDTIS